MPSVPTGIICLISIYGTHYNPTVWPDSKVNSCPSPSSSLLPRRGSPRAVRPPFSNKQINKMILRTDKCPKEIKISAWGEETH
jgi:hypothetical protein